MCILGEKELKLILRDQEFMALLDLTERERRIVGWRSAGFTYEIIASHERLSVSRVQKLFENSMIKMRKQLLKVLKQKMGGPATGTSRGDAIIVSLGKAWNGGEGEAPGGSLLAG